jgi:hypothetical protein
LKEGNIQFLHSLQPHASTTYGHVNKARVEEPAMKDLLAWGYDAPVIGDFIKN